MPIYREPEKKGERERREERGEREREGRRKERKKWSDFPL